MQLGNDDDEKKGWRGPGRLSRLPHPLRRPHPPVRLPIIQQLPHLLKRHGLRHEQVHAARKRLALIPAGREARQRHDQRRPVAVRAVVAAGVLDVADGAGGFEAVHDGHADVCGGGRLEGIVGVEV